MSETRELKINTSPPTSANGTSPEKARSPPPPKAQAPMAPVSRETRPMIVGGNAPEQPYPIHLEGAITHGFGRGARFLGIPTANLPDSSLDPLNELGLTGIFFGFARIHPSDDTPHPTALPTASPSPTPTPSEQNGHAPRSTTLIRHLSDLHASGSLPVPGQEKKLDLDAEAISAIPAHTAPYPSNSCAGMDGSEKRRLGKEDGKVWPMVMSVGYNPYFKNEKLTAEVHIIHSFQNDFYAHDMSVIVLGYIRPELDYVSKEALISDINTDVKVALNSLARPEWASFSTHPFLAERRGSSAGFEA